MGCFPVNQVSLKKGFKLNVFDRSGGRSKRFAREVSILWEDIKNIEKLDPGSGSSLI